MTIEEFTLKKLTDDGLAIILKINHIFCGSEVRIGQMCEWSGWGLNHFDFFGDIR